MSATSAARNPPGDGPRTTSPRLGLIAASTGAIAAVAAHRPHVARADDDDEIGCVQRGLGGIGETAGKIAHHGDSPAPARIDHGIHRPGIQFVAAPGAREKADRRGAAATPHARPARPAGRPVKPSPANAGRVSSRRPATNRCHRPRDRGRPTARRWRQAPGRPRTRRHRHRRSPPITATTSPRSPSSRADSAASASPRTKSSSCSGSRSTCCAPAATAAAQVAGRGVGGGQHGDVCAPRQPGPATPISCRLVEHHRRRRRPRLPAHRRAAGMHHPDPDGRGHPVQFVAQLRIGQHRQYARRTRRCAADAAGHPPTVRGRDRGTPVPNPDLWRETQVCTKTSSWRTLGTGLAAFSATRERWGRARKPLRK